MWGNIITEGPHGQAPQPGGHLPLYGSGFVTDQGSHKDEKNTAAPAPLAGISSILSILEEGDSDTCFLFPGSGSDSGSGKLASSPPQIVIMGCSQPYKGVFGSSVFLPSCVKRATRSLLQSFPNPPRAPCLAPGLLHHWAVCPPAFSAWAVLNSQTNCLLSLLKDQEHHTNLHK